VQRKLQRSVTERRRSRTRRSNGSIRGADRRVDGVVVTAESYAPAPRLLPASP